MKIKCFEILTLKLILTKIHSITILIHFKNFSIFILNLLLLQ